MKGSFRSKQTSSGPSSPRLSQTTITKGMRVKMEVNTERYWSTEGIFLTYSEGRKGWGRLPGGSAIFRVDRE